MNIPAQLIRPYVIEFVDDAPVMNGPLPGLTVLAEKTELHYDTIQHIWSGEANALEFDVVDRILCAVGAVQAWFAEPLAEYYRGRIATRPRKPKSRCHRVGCSNKIPQREWPGGQPSKYCSVKCRISAQNKRQRNRFRKGRYSNHKDKCVNGHDWNEENTYVTKTGHWLCRVCIRDRARERRRLARQARLEDAA